MKTSIAARYILILLALIASGTAVAQTSAPQIAATPAPPLPAPPSMQPTNSTVFTLPTVISTATPIEGRGIFIRIGDAKLKKSLIAIPTFQPTIPSMVPEPNKKLAQAVQNLFDIFKSDLEMSALFDFIKPEAFLEDVSKVGPRPSTATEPSGFKFDSWQQIKAEFLVRAAYTLDGDKLSLSTYIYDVTQSKLVAEKSYSSTLTDVRVAAHSFANDLLKELTGVSGAFLSKIVTSRSTGPEEKEIFVMNWDGGGVQQITHHKSKSISPAWSWNGKMLAYSVYAYHPRTKMRNLDLFRYDFSNAKSTVVSYEVGQNSGACFTPDDQSIVFTSSHDGKADIYRIGIDGHGLTKINGNARTSMSVEPAVSPDGKMIAFSSDRSGNPMIFTMKSDGSDVKRMTETGAFNSTPAWSPDGRKIAFAAQDKDHYDIFTMNPDGTAMKRLTSAKTPEGRWSNNEEPSFSPDGRLILFRSNRTGHYQLFVISVEGDQEKQITSDAYEYFKPQWSHQFE